MQLFSILSSTKVKTKYSVLLVSIFSVYSYTYAPFSSYLNVVFNVTFFNYHKKDGRTKARAKYSSTIIGYTGTTDTEPLVVGDHGTVLIYVGLMLLVSRRAGVDNIRVLVFCTYYATPIAMPS